MQLAYTMHSGHIAGMEVKLHICKTSVVNTGVKISLCFRFTLLGACWVAGWVGLIGSGTWWEKEWYRLCLESNLCRFSPFVALEQYIKMFKSVAGRSARTADCCWIAYRGASHYRSERAVRLNTTTQGDSEIYRNWLSWQPEVDLCVLLMRPQVQWSL